MSTAFLNKFMRQYIISKILLNTREYSQNQVTNFSIKMEENPINTVQVGVQDSEVSFAVFL